MHYTQIRVITIVLLWLTLACAPKPSEVGASPQVTAVSHPTIQSLSPVDAAILENADVVQLLEYLRKRGLTLQNPEASRAAFLYPVPGIVYRLERGWLHIHLFSSVLAAEQRASQMLPEMTPSVIDWVDKPHFYRCKSIIVLYLGTNVEIRQALNEFCGVEFAGP